MGCNCGGRKNRQGANVARSTEYVDPTRALFAAAKPAYEVLPNSTAAKGKRFTTLAGAQDFARRTGGIIRTV